jgi:molybdenum cofactor synthesis domain-containing protein
MKRTNLSHRAQASLITIGTEITDGQILNSNAKTLATEFNRLGFEMVRHLSVPDDRSLMLQSFELCSKDSDFVCIVGGLGPTSDDFTRSCVAEYLKRELTWDESSWSRIVERLNARRIPIAESNKQQCYYPEGSQIHLNPQGTANAFSLIHHQKLYLCLPGPPREIKSIFDSNPLLAQIQTLFADQLKPDTLLKWKVTGVSESILGEWVQSVLKDPAWKVGYRPHPPYVEIKVWVPHGFCLDHPELKALDHILLPYLLYRNDEDPCESILKKLQNLQVSIIEQGLKGAFYDRCSQCAPSICSQLNWNLLKPEGPFLPKPPYLFLKGEGENALLQLQTDRHQYELHLQSPYHGTLLLDRSAKYFVEMTLLQLKEWLS